MGGQGSAAQAFDRDAGDYDAARRKLIPCFDDFYGTALRLIEDRDPGPDPKVLDLGAGTGLFASMVLARLPGARIHLMDASPEMLARARRRFSADDRISFVAADMAEADLGGPWDLVISALAIHHLDHDRKRDLFGRIRHALRPDGLFVNAEQVAGPGPGADERYERVWLEDIRRLGASEPEIDAARRRMAHDICATVEDQLRWMREAGFADVDCSFKAWRFAVLSGRA